MQSSHPLVDYDSEPDILDVSEKHTTGAGEAAMGDDTVALELAVAMRLADNGDHAEGEDADDMDIAKALAEDDRQVVEDELYARNIDTQQHYPLRGPGRIMNRSNSSIFFELTVLTY